MTSPPAGDRMSLPAVAVDGAGVVGVANYLPGSSYGPRRLVDFEFVWLLSGSAIWTVHDGGPLLRAATPPPVALRPGTLLLAPAGAVDSYRWDADQATTHAWAHFRVLDPARLPHPAGWPLLRNMTTSPVLGALCGYLVELAGQETPEARERSDQLMGLLLDLFVRGPLEDPPPALPPQLAAALEVVRRVWSVDGVRLVAVEELATATSMSAGHLYRIFRRHCGSGPARALELIRLSRAAVLLQRSNASLEEVATASGFANAYHLSRRFRLAYGVPPGGYRRRHTTADPLGPLRAAGLLPLAQALAGS